MKFKVSKDVLVGGLGRVQGLVAARNTMPVLLNVLIEAEGNQLRLTTTDLELTSQTTLEAAVAKGGSTTLPLKRLLAVVRECVADEVEFDITDNEAKIAAGSANFIMKGIRADDFPALPQFADTRAYSLPQDDFKRMLQRTAYAASNDPARGAINGVLLEFKDRKLTVVATDGRRLALVDGELEFPREAEGALVVPPRAVSELGRVLAGDEPLRIRASANQVAFEAGNYILMSKLMDGVFPNFRQVIPGAGEHRVEIPREEFLGALRRVAAVAMDYDISLYLTFARNKLEIFGSVAEVGQASESLAVKYDGQSTKISFNPEYLIEPLKNLASDALYFEFNDDIGPGVLKTEESFLYVIMPVRVS
jgi:DNA polymerase III subunit beta